MKQINRSLNAVLILLTVILWATLNPTHATAQSKETYSTTASLADANGYRINQPFHLKINLTCTQTPCPSELILQLGPHADFVGAQTSNQPITTKLDLSNQRVDFSFDPIPSGSQLSIETTLVITTMPDDQPTLQLGLPGADGISWIDEVQLFAADDEPQPTPTTSKVTRESDLFLRSDFEFGENHPLSLILAPANRSGETLDTLTLITRFPDGVYAAEIDSGWYTHTADPDLRPSLEISYQITDTWQTWTQIDDLGQNNRPAIANPLLVPSEEDPETTISLFDTAAIKAIKFEYKSIPANFRWGADRTSQPTIALDIAPRLLADWLSYAPRPNTPRPVDQTASRWNRAHHPEPNSK